MDLEAYCSSNVNAMFLLCFSYVPNQMSEVKREAGSTKLQPKCLHANATF